MIQGGLQHMSIDQHGQHAQRLIVLDEAHAAHVGGEVVDFVGTFGRIFAVFLEIQIEGQILDVIEALVPLVERFCVDGSDTLALLAKLGNQMATDEATSACYNNPSIVVYSS
jgi:hypothetical protein